MYSMIAIKDFFSDLFDEQFFFLQGTPREVLPKPDENSVMETVIKGSQLADQNND